MGYDGTVKIGTELDSSGVKKGLDEINGTAQSGFSKFSEIGKNLTALRQIAPEDVETSFYPPENIRRKEDFRHIGLCGYSRFVLCGREVNLTYISYS